MLYGAYGIQYEVVWCRLYGVGCMVYTVCIIMSVLCISHAADCLLCGSNLIEYCSTYSIEYTVWCILYGVCCIQYVVYSMLYVQLKVSSNNVFVSYYFCFSVKKIVFVESSPCCLSYVLLF